VRIYLDNCTLNRPFDDHSVVKNFLEAQAKFEIQEKIKNGELLLVWSYILSYENSVNPFPEVRYQIEGWKQYAVEEIIETPDTVKLSTSFTEMGLKSKDALHVACAVHGKCRFFITTDKRILKRSISIGDIRVVSPLQFIDSEE
jgi:predicted nucleic acid-binding protein